MYPDSLCNLSGGETHRRRPQPLAGRRPAHDSGLRGGSAWTTHMVVGRSASSLPGTTASLPPALVSYLVLSLGGLSLPR